MVALMIVSIISPCRNEVDHVDAFLRGASHQEANEFELEIIVADGGSDDGTADVLASWSARDKRITVVSNPDRVVSAGLNKAMKMAQGDIIVRMDVHTEYANDYVAQCVRELKRTGATCVGGPWLARGNSVRQKAIAEAFGSVFGSGGAKSRSRDYLGRVDTVYLGAWWRHDLIAFGGFDEGLVRNQDDELCLRIVRSGGTVWQSPAIRSRYIPRDTFRALWEQFYQYGYWKAAIVKKHRSPASLRQLVPTLFCLGVVGLLLASLIAPPAGILAAAVIVSYLTTSLLVATKKASTLYGVALVTFSFFCMHLGYGIGFAHGVLHFILLRRQLDLRMRH
jgi:glycosyltransferase involved in cell wall biosynthesis